MKGWQYIRGCCFLKIFLPREKTYLLSKVLNSKKSKQEQELRNSLQIGDEITTIGGIVGRVIAIREEADEIVLETGSEKTKMVFKRWAISTVNSDKDKTAEKTDKTEKKGFFGRKKKNAEENPVEK